MVRQKKGIILMSIALAFVLTALDSTIVATSINRIIDDIGGLDKIVWIYTTYALAGTSTMLIFGKLSDLFGRKTFYLIGIGIFLLGSALCGMATSIEDLIFYRIIQGIGSGAIFPISFSLLYSLFTEPKDSARLSGVFGAVFGLSSIAGPQIGTWISETLSWRWCFYVNLPIGIVSFISLLLTLQESRAETKPKIDVFGALLIVISTVSCMLAMEMGGKEYAWNSVIIISMFALSAVALITFYFVEQRVQEPILSLKLFHNRMVTGTSIVVFCQGALIFSAMSYLPLYSTYVLGESNLNVLLTPFTLSMICGALLIGYLQTYFLFRTVMFVSMMLGIGVFILLMNITLDVPYWKLIGLVIILGFAVIGPLNNVSQSAVAYSVDKQFLGSSASLIGFSRSIGGVMGLSVMAVIVNYHMKLSVKAATAQFNLTPHANPMYNPLDYEIVFRYRAHFDPQLISFYKLAMGNAITLGFIIPLCASIIGTIAALNVGSAKLQKSSKGLSE